MGPEEIAVIVAAIIALAALPFTIKQARAATRQTALQRSMHNDLVQRQFQLQRDAEQPYVWVDIMPSDAQASALLLTVCNEGPTVATNIQITFDPPPEVTDDRDRFNVILEQLAGGLSYLAPNKRLVWFFDVGTKFFNAETVKTTTISVNCDGPHGPCPTNSYTIRIDDIRTTLNAPNGSLRQIEKQLKELTSAVQSSRRSM